MQISKNRMRHGYVFPLAGLLLALFSLVLPATGQAVHGAIIGSVMDTTGSVVPGATVTLTDTDKGVVRTTKSNAIGQYQFLEPVINFVPLFAFV